MPWLFDTPIAAGDLDPNAPTGQYTHCRLQMLGNDPDSQTIPLTLTYGWMDGGTYVPGGLMPVGKPSEYMIQGADWVTLVTTSVSDVKLSDPSDPSYIEIDIGGTPVWVEKTYITSKRTLYEFLVSKGIIEPGSVV